jgi:ketosteroid isomerase-like protein
VSQENLKNLHRLLDAFNRRDRDTWLELLDPACENVPPQEWPESAPIRGGAAIWDFYVEAVESWEEGPFEWGELVDGGTDRVMAHQRREMRGKASGVQVEWSYWVVFTFRNGTVVRSEWFADRTQAVQAAGLEEQGVRS